MNPFDYVNQILYGKNNLITDKESEKDYAPFIINRSLSYHKDCVMFANEMNQRPHTEKKMQNDFLLNTIRSRKRPFTKWIKSKKDDNLDYIKTYYGFSTNKALEVIDLISEENMEKIKEELNTGGIKKK